MQKHSKAGSLVIDLFEDPDEQLELYTAYLEWMQLAYREGHTDGSLKLATMLHADWKNAAIKMFGKDEFEGMIVHHLDQSAAGPTMPLSVR